MALLPRTLVFDLECAPDDQEQFDKIIHLAGFRPDTGAELEQKVSGDPQPALQALDEMVQGAAFALGHNIYEHDLPVLRKQAPGMQLLKLPAVDTLRLSPLAFPQNPYHRLIKDYKLIRDSLNSPLADCRSTLELFADQQDAFEQLNEKNRMELLCYQALLAPGRTDDLSSFFAYLAGGFAVGLDQVRQMIPQLLRETDSSFERDLKVCATRLQKLLDVDLQNEDMRWPIAYALSWLRVSGGNSVLAPWVRYQFPATGQLLSELRDIPCADEACSYCRETHDPRRELKRYFGFDDFRYEAPGQSLQHDIVLASMQGEHVLAVLATGGGKSLCYQLPALNRYHRNGSLTVIISPLQSLMKDQVDGLLAKGVQSAAALNGLLTMPERADVLEKIQMGDVGILLVSPEQFRNKAFRGAIKQRQIGGWIFDEAHCLSRWGSDFRPDYLYVSRFIREEFGGQPLAPIGCFTATAKQDVLQDIQAHFREALGVEFRLFQGSHERKNLGFEVIPAQKSEKNRLVHQLLGEHLGGQPGGAVVFVASRKHSEELAQFLAGQGWACEHFHAGLEPHHKTDIQNDFIRGELRVIVATNAFGMGVDKEDVRLVVHADIPGSLENYLQEAGRAGRDREDAHCVLLYDEQDIERQFGMVERSRLSQRDIQQILRKLRNEYKSRKGAKLVITAGEILLDDQVETSFDSDDNDAETKVVTAIAWLERANFLRRDENHTQIFPAHLDRKLEEALEVLEHAGLPQRREQEFRAILRFLYSTDVDKSVNTDQLMELTGLTSDEVSYILRQMEEMGLLVNDSKVTVYLRRGIPGHSQRRLESSLRLEEAVFQLLPELAPDAEQGGWQDLYVPALTGRLKEQTGQQDLLPLHVLRLLRSLSEDFDPANMQHRCFELRETARDYVKLRLNSRYSWSKIGEFGAKRRQLAGVLLRFLLGKLPDGLRGKDLLVDTTFGELVQALEDDLNLKHLIEHAQRRNAVERTLLYLHRQEILTLNHGMTVMRRAMSIEVNEEKTGTFIREDYLRLDDHYREKRIQVHVMREYAQLALQKMGEALQLVLDYFTQPRQVFIRRYFSGREQVLKLATSEESWRAIVDSLNPVQRLIVTDDNDLNRLVLAGPGSGKTRVIVHRIAYLLRVRRVPARSIIALTFNRHAANEIRERLLQLVGSDAYGVSVFTYHRMAMRLTGASFNRGEKAGEEELGQILRMAVAMLEGSEQVEGEDDLREQLMRGYRYILVDEYQDIDEWQYRLVGALAGRTADEDGKLCILAVGDDDQNIYAWRDTSNRFIESFQQDYAAEIDFLIHNYRSSLHIIRAANLLIEANGQRMKAEHPICINPERAQEPAGGCWVAQDSQRAGLVARLCIHAGRTRQANLQAQAAMAELQRLLRLENGEWHGCAVLARTHEYLQPLQALCEQQGVPYYLAADKDGELPHHRQRSFVAVLDALRSKTEACTPVDAWQQLCHLAAVQPARWQAYFSMAFAQLQAEVGECRLQPAALIDWLYDYAGEMREQAQQGLHLGTVHSAKGLEFRHVVVLDGGWSASPTTLEEERRLYYVAMTRAEQTLTLCEFETGNPFVCQLVDVALQQNFQGQFLPGLQQRFVRLSLKDIYLDYAGRQPENAAIHRRIAAIEEGDTLVLRENSGAYDILTESGDVVGRTAKQFKPPFHFQELQVAAVITRYREDSTEGYREQCRVERWEIVVPRGASAKTG